MGPGGDEGCLEGAVGVGARSRSWEFHHGFCCVVKGVWNDEFVFFIGTLKNKLIWCFHRQ